MKNRSFNKRQEGKFSITFCINFSIKNWSKTFFFVHTFQEIQWFLERKKGKFESPENWYKHFTCLFSTVFTYKITWLWVSGCFAWISVILISNFFFMILIYRVHSHTPCYSTMNIIFPAKKNTERKLSSCVEFSSIIVQYSFSVAFYFLLCWHENEEGKSIWLFIFCH